MELSANVQAYMAAYEQENGKPLGSRSLKVISHVDLVSAQLKKKGEEDAAKEREPYAHDFFCNLFRRVFNLAPGGQNEAVEAVADLWQNCYKEGYDAKGEYRCS